MPSWRLFPWLLSSEDMPHVGTLDVDLSLDAELWVTEYATLVEALMAQGYNQRRVPQVSIGANRSQRRTVPTIDIVVDFLTPRDGHREEHPPLV